MSVLVNLASAGDHSISPWIAAFSGGLAGALLTVSWQWFRAWFDSPRLTASFDGNIPGCLIQTPAGFLQKDLADIARTCRQHYVRLKVKNAGRTVARGVVANLVEIRQTNAQGVTTEFSDEVLDLVVGLVGGTTIPVLPRGCHRFFDIAHVEQRDDTIAHHFDVKATPFRLADLKFGPGKFEAKIQVAAENADPITTSARWSWNGTIDGVSVVAEPKDS